METKKIQMIQRHLGEIKRGIEMLSLEVEDAQMILHVLETKYSTDDGQREGNVISIAKVRSEKESAAPPVAPQYVPGYRKVADLLIAAGNQALPFKELHGLVKGAGMFPTAKNSETALRTLLTTRKELFEKVSRGVYRVKVAA